MGTQLVGGGVINYYQTIIYKSLGSTGYQVLLIAAAYGTVGPIATISAANVDKWSRVPTLVASQSAVLIVFIFVTVLSAVYGSSDNRGGQIAVIVFIFLFSGSGFRLFCNLLDGNTILCSFDNILLGLFCSVFPETNGKSLEEINGLFGDVVVHELDIEAKE